MCRCGRLRARERLDCSQMKTLVIAEKPSVAQDIVRALTPLAGKFEKSDEYFENERYVVSSAVGHLVELPAPDASDVTLGKARFTLIPGIWLHFSPQPVVINNTHP